MKKVFFLLLLAINCIITNAQIPQGFNYQAVVRNADGEVLQDKPIKITIAIKTALTGGTVIREEYHDVTTNKFGLVSFAVGSGTYVSGPAASFDMIDWKAQPLFLKTSVEYPVGTVTEMGTAQILSVPYSLVAKDVEGPIEKLGIRGSESSVDSALFEVKNKIGQTVFAVYPEGVRVYVADGAKGKKGGFAVGSFGEGKAESQKYLVVSKDSIRIYLDSNPATKKTKGGFAVGGYDMSKGADIQNYLDVSEDSVRIYIDNNPLTKGKKGGFAVGSYDMSKNGVQNFFNVAIDTTGTIKPSQNRILWYPQKNAFMTGKVLIENKDSVGVNSFASGYESKAKGKYSQALGYKAIARGDYSTAIGKNAVANSLYSFAFGSNARALYEETYAFGSNSQASGKGSVAIGFNSTATGWDAFAIGAGTMASGLGSFAIGFIGRDSSNLSTGSTVASQNYAVAIGMGAKASNKGAFSMGTQTISEGNYSFALGYRSRSSGWYSLSTGYGTLASGNFSTAMGYGSVASGSHSVAMGQGSLANNWYSVAIGPNAVAEGHQSVAFGSETHATGIFSLAMGKSSVASGVGSIAIGFNNQALDYAASIGYETYASGQYSTSVGYRTTASGISSIAAGNQTTASGGNSSSFGSNTKAGGEGSFSAGLQSEANGSASAAFGSLSLATGSYSFAAGLQSYAQGAWSVALGQYCKATTWNTFAMGGGTIAKGYLSTAFGLMTKAKPFASFVIGQYNDSTCSTNGNTSWVSSDPLFIIGNGSGSSSTGNAFTVLKNGYTAIGHAAPTQMLDVNGNARFRIISSGTFSTAIAITNDGTLTTSTSDISMKRDIVPISEALSKVSEMNGVFFSWKNDDMRNRRVGFIAQDMEKVLPEVVFTNPVDGLKGINYSEITAVLAQAIKEQQQQIESQQKEINELKTLLNILIAKQTVQVTK